MDQVRSPQPVADGGEKVTILPPPVSVTDFYLSAVLQELKGLRKLLSPPISEGPDVRIKENIQKRGK